MTSCYKKFPGTRKDKGGGALGPFKIQVDDAEENLYLLASYSVDNVQLSSNSREIRFQGGGSRVVVSTICPNGSGESGCDYTTMKRNKNCGLYQVASQNAYRQWTLLGKTMSFDVDTSNADFCCNLALYLVSMPGAYVNQQGQTVLYDGAVGDFVCDANAWSSLCIARSQPVPPYGGQVSCPGGGSSCADYIYCPELDILEVNKHGLHMTLHGCKHQPTMSAQNGGYLFNTGSAANYMNGDELSVTYGNDGLPLNVTVNNADYANCSKTYGNSICHGDGYVVGMAGTGMETSNYFGDKSYGEGGTIDSTKPFHVDISFQEVTDQDKKPTVQVDYTVSQGSNQLHKSVTYPNANGNYGQSLVNALKRGMVLVMSYWFDTENTTAWLDGGPKSGTCTHYSDSANCTCSKPSSGDCTVFNGNDCTDINCPRLSMNPGNCGTCGEVGLSNITIRTSSPSPPSSCMSYTTCQSQCPPQRRGFRNPSSSHVVKEFYSSNGEKHDNQYYLITIIVIIVLTLLVLLYLLLTRLDKS